MAAIALGGLASGPGSLQSQGWSVDLQATRATFGAVPLAPASTNATVGLRHFRDERAWSAVAAAPLGSDQLLWGVLSGSDRIALRRGRFELGADLSGLAHAQRDPTTDLRGSGALGRALAFGSVSMGALVTEVRSGGSWYTGRIGDEGWTRRLHETELALVLPFELESRWGLRLGADLRHLRGDGIDESDRSDDAYTRLGASVMLGAGRFQAWLDAGHWVDGLADGTPKAELGGGVSTMLSHRTTLRIQVRREAFNPLFPGTDRTSWGIGISRGLGSVPPRASRAGAEIRGGGHVVLRLPVTETGTPPMVAGDFSGWESLPMDRRGTNWEIRLDLSPGLYNYAFRDAEGRWFVPEGVEGRRDDGMGGWVARILVPEETR